jgi:hypothetical protein
MFARRKPHTNKQSSQQLDTTQHNTTQISSNIDVVVGLLKNKKQKNTQQNTTQHNTIDCDCIVIETN